jgi:poly-gamma-glutamate capsule biosynthesis protein CapA/YwtB (metallophosphatase superfamily)
MQRAAKEGEKSDKKEKRKSTLSSLTSAVLSPIFKKRKDKDRLKHSNSEARIDRSSFEPEVQKSASSADVVVQLIHSEEYLPEQYKGKDMSLSSGGIPQIEISDGKQKNNALQKFYCY